MTTGLDALTEKEKQTLRLILRGHDAKSAARELALSVHTVKERLRDALRKLGVTSSREAARRLLAEETSESLPKFLRTSLWGMRPGRFLRQRSQHPPPGGGRGLVLGPALPCQPSECLPCR